MLNKQETLKIGKTRRLLVPQAWLILPAAEQKLHLSFSDGSDDETCELHEGGLVLLDQSLVTPLTGDISFRSLKMELFSKLLAFADGAGLVETSDEKTNRWLQFSPEYRSIWGDRKRCECWFLQQIMMPSLEFRALVPLLRKSESYWLISFLLAQSTSGNTMRTLGGNYGVSYSHFRRLCRQALGNRAKSELRNWRMAQSLLNGVEGWGSITQLAVNNGYSSPSHFSNEIKELIGVSPRKLSNILQLADK